MKIWLEMFFELAFEALPCTVIFKDGKKVPVYLPQWNVPYTLEESLKLYRSGCNAILLKTGKAYNLLVIDIDRKNGKDGEESLKKLGIQFPEAPQVQTPCGRHIWFKHPENFQNSTRANLFFKNSGIDIRGNDGFVYVPPTNIFGYGEYSWLISPYEIDLPVLPPEFLELLQNDSSSFTKNDWPVYPGTSPKYTGSKLLNDMTDRQNSIIHQYLSNATKANIGERSSKEFALVFWCVCCDLLKTEIEQLCRGWGKFKTNGQEYFELTYQNALSKAVQENRVHQN